MSKQSGTERARREMNGFQSISMLNKKHFQLKMKLKGRLSIDIVLHFYCVVVNISVPQKRNLTPSNRKPLHALWSRFPH